MAGYIKDHRQELDSKIWTMPPLYHRVWQYLKYKACFRETQLQLKDGSILRVGPGQYFTSVREIARGVAWSERGNLTIPNPKMVDTVLKWLQVEEMVTIEGVVSSSQGNGLGNAQSNAKSNGQSNTLGTLVTLVNWALFQDFKNESNTQSNGLSNDESNGLGNENKNKDLKNKDLSVLPFEKTRENEEKTDLGDGVPSTDPQGEISLFKQIETHYLMRRAYGFDLSGNDIVAIQALVDSGIPVETILTGIDDAFMHYKPRFEGDKIKSVKYCDPVIREKHYRNQTREERQQNAESDRGGTGHGKGPPAVRKTAADADKSGYYDQFPGLIQSL